MAEGEVKKEEKKGEEKKVEEKVVTMSEAQYAALLDRVAELEDTSLARPKDKIYDIDELAEEGRRGKVATTKDEEVDWESLSNKELVGKIAQVVNQGGVELSTKIETLKVLREIDKCEIKYEDFWKYEQDIRKIASENPTLSIEKAYRLAKLEKEGDKKVDKKEGDKEEEVGAKTTRTEKLLNLPPRGEKPGVVSSSTKGTQIKTLREATERAWDEAVGKSKESI